MQPDTRHRWFALLGVFVFFGLIWLYVREFAVFANTIGAGRLVIGSALIGLLLAAGMLWRWRDRFTPWGRHLPEVLLILISGALFTPLFGSLLNRGLGRTGNQSFQFIAEVPYLASNYGVLKGEKLQPTGYILSVRDKNRLRTFKYKTQAFYPLTKPGDTVLLPVRNGLFGFRVMLLK